MDNSLSEMFSTSGMFDNSFTENTSDYEHLRIIFEEVLYTVSYVDVEEIIFKDEIPKLKLACDEVVEKISVLIQKNNSDTIEEIKSQIQKYICLINFGSKAINYINKKVQFIQIQSLPLSVCEILLNTFQHCKESDILYGNYFMSLSSLLTELFKNANTLQNNILSLLNNFIIFNLNEEFQLKFLVNVIQILSKIGQIVSNLDIKTAAELWKGYLALSQTHNDKLKSLVNIEDLIKYFCKEVSKVLVSIKTTDLKSLEKILKISSFHLKIVIKLCGLYDYLGNAYGDLFDLLISLNSYSIPYLQYQKINHKLIDLLQIYVVVAAEPLLGSLMNSREFVQYFYKNIKNQFNNDDKRLAAILLIVSVLRKLLIGNIELYNLWLSHDMEYNIIFVIFDALELLHVEFSIDLEISILTCPGEPNKLCSLYEYLLIYTVASVINFNKNYFKLLQKTLFQSIMQTNVWKAMFSADIWCILVRYGSAEFCYQQLLFLINVYLTLEKYERIEIVFLKNVMNRLFKLLTQKYKNDIMQQYPVNKYQNLWIIFDIENDNSLEIANKNIDEFFNNSNLDNFNKMCLNLEVLTSNSIKSSNDIVKKNITAQILKLWNLNFNVQLQSYSWQLRFLEIISKTIIILINIFTNKELLNILQKLLELDETQLKVKLIQCKILKTLASKNVSASSEQTLIFEAIAKLFRILLKDKNPIIKQIAFETFSYFACHTVHEIILAIIVQEDVNLQESITNYLEKKVQPTSLSQIEYFKLQSNVKFEHNCIEFKDIEPVLKKKKLISDVDINAIIGRLKFDSDLLKEHFSSENIPEPISIDLSNIICKLKSLLSK